MAPSETQGFELKPIRSPQLYEQVVERLRGQILAGLLAPGDRLPPERELARALGVGRGSIREALAALQNDDLVQTRQGAGSFIADDALEQLAEIEEHHVNHVDVSPLAVLEVREILDPAIARSAAMRAQRDDELEQLLARMDDVDELADPVQRRTWSDSDRMFHWRLASISGSQLLQEFYARLAEIMNQPLWRRLRDQGASEPRRVRLYAAEHRLIYECIANGEPEAASFHAVQHVVHVRAGMVSDERHTSPA